VVTFTRKVTTGTGKKKKTVAKTAQILWKVVANDVEVNLGFNDAGGVVESGVVGLKYGDLLAFSATEGATVTTIGLPAGIKLAKLDGGGYAFTGFTTKAGTYLVTVKAALKGELSKGTVAIVREEAKKYKVAFAPVPIANAAKYTRSVPKEYIAKNGHDVTEAFLEYARPIVGELPPCEVL
jgi:hypothetical protein